MNQIDFMSRTLTGIIAIGFVIAGIFGVLDYFIVKFLLIAVFICVVLYMFYKLYDNKNHPGS